jgi:hypothetical protein
MSLLDVLDSIQIDEEAQTIPDNPPDGTDVEPQTVVPPPAFPNQEMTGYKVQVQQPETSTTTVETRQSENTLSRQDWENMTGQERYDAFLKRIGQNPPAAPVNPEEQERRLRSQGLLRAVGDGLFTLGEAVGLGMGSYVRKRNMPEGDEFKRAYALRTKYGDDVLRWEDSMRSYYDKVYQYNQLQAKDYDRYREGQTSKVSTATRSGGDTWSYEYENPEIAKRKFDNEKKLINLRGYWNNKSKPDETQWNIHPVGMSGKTYQWSIPSNSMQKITANALSSRMKEYNLPEDARARIKTSIKDGNLENPSTWSDADNIRYNTQMIDELLQRGEDLIIMKDNELKSPVSQKIDPLYDKDSRIKAINDEIKFISDILESIEGTGFKIKYD